MKPLDPKKYNCKIVGSDKVYYAHYPFKVRLLGNSINYEDIDKSLLVRSAKDALILDFIESLPEKFFKL